MPGGFRRVKPTKPNLDRLKKKRAFADRGAHLLELKRKQILERFKQIMQEYMRQREKTHRMIKKAYRLLNTSYMLYGKRRIKVLANLNKIHYEPKVQMKFINYMGVDVPKISFSIGEKEKLPSYSFQDTPLEFDELNELMEEIMTEIARLAELDYQIFHFAQSYRKIQRRISALESIVIPKLDEDIATIEEILEDLEREELIRMKKIKEMLHPEKNIT